MGNTLASLGNTGDAHLKTAVSIVRLSVTRALRFALKLLALCGLSAIILAFPLTTLALKPGPAGIQTSPVYVYGIVLLLSVAIAYVISPQAIHLLRPASAGPISHQQAHVARVSASAAVAFSTALSLLVAQAHIPLWGSWHDHAILIHAIIDVVGSWIVASPYIPLFISFYLIANPDGPFDAIPETANSSLPESLPPSISA